jgi:hypothetical protein
MFAPSLPPPPILQQMTPGNHPAWGASRLPAMPPSMHDRQARRRSGPPDSPRRRRPRPLRLSTLVVGALIMALLAFGITRACLSTATSKPAAARK